MWPGEDFAPYLAPSGIVILSALYPKIQGPTSRFSTAAGEARARAGQRLPGCARGPGGGVSCVEGGGFRYSEAAAGGDQLSPRDDPGKVRGVRGVGGRVQLARSLLFCAQKFKQRATYECTRARDVTYIAHLHPPSTTSIPIPPPPHTHMRTHICTHTHNTPQPNDGLGAEHLHRVERSAGAPKRRAGECLYHIAYY